MRRSIEDAKRAGLRREEVAHAQSQLQALSQSGVSKELAEAMASGDPVRLRAAAKAATEAGLTGAEVDSAWQRLRAVESHSWLRQQLDSALASGDAIRLQAAIKQAEMGGLPAADLNAAKKSLDGLNARLHARQELHLAKISGNPYVLMQAIRQGQEAGLSQRELDVAQGIAAPSEVPGTNPNLELIPTQPQLQTMTLQQPPTQPNLMQQPSTQPQLQMQGPPTQLGLRSSQGPPTQLDLHGTGTAYSSTVTDPRFQSTVTEPRLTSIITEPGDHPDFDIPTEEPPAVFQKTVRLNV